MYTHLLTQRGRPAVKQLHPEWKESTVKNTLLMVALLLTEKTVNLWKLKAGVSKQLGNTEVDSRSHYQRLKRWPRDEKPGGAFGRKKPGLGCGLRLSRLPSVY